MNRYKVLFVKATQQQPNITPGLRYPVLSQADGDFILVDGGKLEPVPAHGLDFLGAVILNTRAKDDALNVQLRTACDDFCAAMHIYYC